MILIDANRATEKEQEREKEMASEAVNDLDQHRLSFSLLLSFFLSFLSMQSNQR